MYWCLVAFSTYYTLHLCSIEIETKLYTKYIGHRTREFKCLVVGSMFPQSIGHLNCLVLCPIYFVYSFNLPDIH